jgi:hypothetical protein
MGDSPVCRLTWETAQCACAVRGARLCVVDSPVCRPTWETAQCACAVRGARLRIVDSPVCVQADVGDCAMRMRCSRCEAAHC